MFLKRNGLLSWLFCWNLSPSFGNHECTYAWVLLSLFESGLKTGVWRNIKMMHNYINTKNNSKIGYSYHNNWCTSYILAKASKLLSIIAYGDSPKWYGFDNWFHRFMQIFMVVIITLSIRFTGIINHCIILCYHLLVACIKTTVHSIRYFNYNYTKTLSCFCPVNW